MMNLFELNPPYWKWRRGCQKNVWRTREGSWWEIEKIKACKNGKAWRVWEIRRWVIGGNKSKIVPTPIINPSTGELTLKKNEIKEATLKYCIETLANNQPAKGFEEVKKKKKDMVAELMKWKMEAHQETFTCNINKSKRKAKKNYNFCRI